MTRSELEAMARDLGGKVDWAVALPDGSGAAVMSMPLPKDHWLTAESSEYEEPPMGFRMGTRDINRWVLQKHIEAAARYAIRAVTRRGLDDDIDPDAWVRNMVIGLIGYNTPDGLSHVGEHE